MNGYIKLFRKMTEWEWYKDVPTFKVFLHLLIVANREDGTFQGVEVKRGQRLTSRSHLAQETGLTDRQVRTALKHLQMTNEVSIKTSNKWTIITVEKYNDYQVCVNTSDQQSDQQSDPSGDHKQEDKKREDIKKKIPTVSKREVPYQEVIDAYHEECPSLPRVMKLTDTRKKHIKARLDQHSIDEMREIFKRVQKSDFLTGRTDNRNGWQADFDFITRSEDSVTKILEGRYDNKENNGRTNRNNKAVQGTAPRVSDEKRQAVEEWEARQRLLSSGK